MNAGISMQFNRISKISRTSSLTGSPTDGSPTDGSPTDGMMLTKTAKLVRCDAMQRT